VGDLERLAKADPVGRHGRRLWRTGEWRLCRHTQESRLKALIIGAAAARITCVLSRCHHVRADSSSAKNTRSAHDVDRDQCIRINRQEVGRAINATDVMRSLQPGQEGSSFQMMSLKRHRARSRAARPSRQRAVLTLTCCCWCPS
jgi:hypothetical protein